MSISDKTLMKSIRKNLPYNGHYYKEIGDKNDIILKWENKTIEIYW